MWTLVCVLWAFQRSAPCRRLRLSVEWLPRLSGCLVGMLQVACPTPVAPELSSGRLGSRPRLQHARLGARASLFWGGRNKWVKCICVSRLWLT